MKIPLPVFIQNFKYNYLHDCGALEYVLCSHMNCINAHIWWLLCINTLAKKKMIPSMIHNNSNYAAYQYFLSIIWEGLLLLEREFDMLIEVYSMSRTNNYFYTYPCIRATCEQLGQLTNNASRSTPARVTFW